METKGSADKHRTFLEAPDEALELGCAPRGQLAFAAGVGGAPGEEVAEVGLETAACWIEVWTVPRAGSIAPSSTMARTCEGNAWAYSVPR